MESDCSINWNEELFTDFSPEIPRGEEVCVFRNQKGMRKNEKTADAGGLCHCHETIAQAACQFGPFDSPRFAFFSAAFFVFAAIFLRLM